MSNPNEHTTESPINSPADTSAEHLTNTSDARSDESLADISDARSTEPSANTSDTRSTEPSENISDARSTEPSVNTSDARSAEPSADISDARSASSFIENSSNQPAKKQASNPVQVISLICAVICYGLTLYSYFRLSSLVFLICFFLSAIFLILFAFLCYRESHGRPDEIDELTERIVTIKSEWKKDTEHLQAALKEKEDACDLLTEQLTAYQDRNTEFMMEIEQLQLENTHLNASVKEQETEPNPSSVLPQYLSEPSESTYVNLIDVTKSVVRELHDDALHAGIQVQVSSIEEEILVKADQNMLRTLFRNIVDNSIKYMKRHGSLIITASTIGEDVFIVCKDTGNGLTESETTHIFDLNYQGSNRISGNGLGLFQAKAIVDYYGGTIYAKSNSGKGMGIYIQLPSA